MLHEVFYWLLSMSISAVITGIFVLLVRNIKKIPKRITVILWLVPFIRMAIPVGLNGNHNLMSLISKITTRSIKVYQPTNHVSVSMMNMTTLADSYFPVTYGSVVLEKIFSISSIIWITVFIAIVLILAIIYFSTLHEMKDSVHMRDNIYFSTKITSPAVYEIIRPKIILPESYSDKDIELILLHERTHIKRRDNLWRVIAVLITAVHWFNPFAWIFLKMFLNDLELSCDECVIAKSGDDRIKEYAYQLVENKRSSNIFASAFSGGRTRKRIENILSFKKMTYFSATVFVLFITALLYVLLTNPR